MATVTIIVSDLHIGGGDLDRGDDHVRHRSQFKTLVEALAGSSDGKRGDCELFINGDFLEFAQVNPDAYQLGSATYWCSEAESLAKLETIISGHPDMFAALGRFQETGNQVTIAAGNHDVDFWWAKVQSRFREVAGNVSFALGEVWHARYDGRLMISHGHMFDPANTFESWNNPILEVPGGPPRLEMCPGTLFMVKFVNWLDHKFPFSDNIKPVTALGRILLREKRMSLVAVAWMLSRFAARHPTAAMKAGRSESRFVKRFAQQLEYDDDFAAGMTQLYRKVQDSDAAMDEVRSKLGVEAALFDFLCALLPKLPPEEWTPVLDSLGSETSLGSGSGGTLKILESGSSNEKEVLRNMARQKLSEPGGPEVIVMGHTHQPDKLETEDGVYFNPGSWTRYVEISKMDDLRLEDLEREDEFPYQLNYVRIENSGAGPLEAELVCYDEADRRG